MDERKVENQVEHVLESLGAERPRFRPAVGRAKPRVRIGFVIVLLCTMTAGAVVAVMKLREPPAAPEREPVTAPSWWSHAGVQCTPLGVETAIRNPSWSPVQRATCLAIAGRIDDARAGLVAMSPGDRTQALQLIFQIAHPIADAGDDRSAGPIMGLVIEFWPENYMAMFHAGMAEFALGNDAVAAQRLERFLVIYTARDVWHARATKALHDIEAKVPTAQREAHFPE